MARETAYRLREKPGAEGFAAVWDMALARRHTRAGLQAYFDAREVAAQAIKPSRKVTVRELRWRFETGKFRVILRQGRFVGVHQIPDNDALLCLLARLTPRRAAFDARAEW